MLLERHKKQSNTNSFPDLEGQSDNAKDFGARVVETDRRKSFIKSLSVKISSKQSTLGKGARNLIIGGSKTEKRRLLDMDDESVLS